MDNRLCECVKLRNEVLTGTWQPRDVKPFSLVERGKLREVMPVAMQDRVVQRCLCDNILIPFIEKEVIDDCSACIKSRGLDYATKRLVEHLKKAPPGSWVFQFDFHDYFHSIDRADALEKLRGKIPDCFIKLIALSVGGTNGIGLDLGSHVCQLVAVWYPTPLDHLIQNLNGFIGYHRYMDDGIAIFGNKQQALNAMHIFTKNAEAIGLTMNPNKTFCNIATKPIVFCKTRLTKRQGEVRVNVRKEQSKRMVKHMRNVKERSKYVQIDLKPVKASCTGYLNRGDADLTRLVDKALAI